MECGCFVRQKVLNGFCKLLESLDQNFREAKRYFGRLSSFIRVPKTSPLSRGQRQIALPGEIASSFGVVEYRSTGVLDKAKAQISSRILPHHYSSRLTHQGKTSSGGSSKPGPPGVDSLFPTIYTRTAVNVYLNVLEEFPEKYFRDIGHGEATPQRASGASDQYHPVQFGTLSPDIS